jgi:hypothetical protein
MKYQFLLFISICIIFALFASGCGDNPVITPGTTNFLKGQGVFITQEGSFTSGNGVLSFYHFDQDSLHEKVYEEKNNEVIGSVLQGGLFTQNQAYLVVNGSGLIIEINPATGKFLNFIQGLNSPNDFIIYEDRQGFVSDLFGPHFYKIDMSTNLKSDSIFVNGGTGELAIVQDRLFVTKTSDFQAPPSSSLFVVNLATFQITDTIAVGFNPTSLVVDADDHLWVLCNGNSFENRKGSLHRINTANLTVIQSIDFPDLNTSFAGRMETDAVGQNIFFLKGNVYKMSKDASSFPAEPLIASGGRSYYGIGIRPDNGDVYVGVEDFITESKVLIYNASGKIQKEFDSQIGANHFYFY